MRARTHTTRAPQTHARLHAQAFVAALLDGLLTSEELGLGSDAVVATLACHAKPNQAHLMAVLPLSPQGLASLTAKVRV